MHEKRSVGLIALALMILSFGSQTAWSQQELGLGMNDTDPRLLGAVRSAAPSASRVESAASAGNDGSASAATALPRTVDLSEHMPTPGHQGPIGSCGAWATAYALRSYQENVERGWGADSDSEVFSPSFLYNLSPTARTAARTFRAFSPCSRSAAAPPSRRCPIRPI